MQKKESGFSLIELLVVVAIILIISAIAIPKLLQAREAANESGAVGDLRALLNAEATYNAKYGAMASTMAEMTGTATPVGCSGANVLDVTQFGGSAIQLSGYNFSFTSPVSPDVTLTNSSGCVVANSFQAVATPISPYTGTHGFFIDDSGVIRYSKDGSPPTVTSPALGQ
jgi:type IV pilus assembly protein PilA